ncbi:hypothetical protein, partial [Alistipes shahii]|uniref:hypothetical protein n=4 Tax=Alistipes TaxID=239759 RepID=UPI003AAD9056
IKLKSVKFDSNLWRPLQTSTEAANAAGKSPDGVRGNGARAMPDGNFPPRKSLEANNFRGLFLCQDPYQPRLFRYRL